jgi:hypothetical protein
MVDKPAPPASVRSSDAAPRQHTPARAMAGSTGELPSGDPRERRRARRRGVRLTWGKALDASDRFLCECLVIDRAQDGARLRLARKVALPNVFHFFDDIENAIYAAQVVWRQNDIVGCRIGLSPLCGKEDVVTRMSSPLYAL